METEIKSLSVIERIKGIDIVKFKEKTIEYGYGNAQPNNIKASNFIVLEFYCAYPRMTRIVKFLDIYQLLFDKDNFETGWCFEKSGLKVDLSNISFCVDNCYTFMKRIFKDINIQDCQHNQANGHPDFKLITDEGNEFYIELKNETDTIRPNQLAWCAENNKEVWYLFVKLGHKFKY